MGELFVCVQQQQQQRVLDLVRRCNTHRTNRAKALFTFFHFAGDVVVKALRYKPAGRGLDSR
jgi:hypothetical protein